MPESRTRQRLAEEAARIVLEEGVRDYGLAKRKAADHLGITGRRDLPANTEIESAVLERNRLFATPGQRREYIARLRTAALVMTRLEPLETRLVGPLLLGIVEPQAVINLHGFAETVEEVMIELGDRGIQCRSGERHYRGAGMDIRAPFLAFRGPEGIDVELTVFPLDGLRKAPPSPIDGRPMRRLNLAGVQGLINDAESLSEAQAR